MKNYCIFLMVILFPVPGYSQQDSAKDEQIIWGAFADFYYAYDFNSPPGRRRALLANGETPIYSHNDHNSFSLNNAILGASYIDEKTRAFLSFHTGTYVRENYAAEPTLFKLIYEAYAGVRVKKGLWIDAGIFPSHIGAESAVSIKSLTLTRSLMADNSPYFESGIRATWEATRKITLSALVINGWQNITENNEDKAIGTQITIKPSEKIVINSSSFIGKETAANSIRPTMRYFHNFYAGLNFERISVLASFDIGFQEAESGNNYNEWYSPNLICRYWLHKNLAVAGRIEYYHDPKGIIINPEVSGGFQTYGYSLNLDYKITEKALWRIEGRVFDSENPVFLSSKQLTSNNIFVISSLSIQIGEYSF